MRNPATNKSPYEKCSLLIVVHLACALSTLLSQDKAPAPASTPYIVVSVSGNGIITNQWSNGQITALVETDKGYVDLPVPGEIQTVNRRGAAMSRSQISARARVQIVRNEDGRGYHMVVDQD